MILSNSGRFNKINKWKMGSDFFMIFEENLQANDSQGTIG